MAKDPAVLWYWNDWLGGTFTFSRHLKGCYMDLLAAQFNTGPLSIDEIKTVLGTDFTGAWPPLQKKFKQTETGLYYNEKLVAESQRRKNFSESRRKNLTSVKKTHMGPHMETDTENKNEKENSNVKAPFESKNFSEAWELWKRFKKQQFNFTYKPIGEQGALKELIELSYGNEETAIAIIHQSIKKGWKGLFELKNQNNGTLTKQTGNLTAHERNLAELNKMAEQSAAFIQSTSGVQPEGRDT